jgi:hypothetical protein
MKGGKTLNEQDATSNRFSASCDITYTLNTIVDSLKSLTELVDDSTEAVRLASKSTKHAEQNIQNIARKSTLAIVGGLSPQHIPTKHVCSV